MTAAWRCCPAPRHPGELLTRSDVCHVHADRAAAERCGVLLGGAARAGPARRGPARGFYRVAWSLSSAASGRLRRRPPGLAQPCWRRAVSSAGGAGTGRRRPPPERQVPTAGPQDRLSAPEGPGHLAGNVCYADRMSTGTKWIIGTGVAIITTIVGTGAVLAGLLLTSIAGVNARIDDVRGELRNFRSEVNTRMDGFDTRLRNVEIAFGKVDQRLLIIERFVLPTPEQPGD